MNSLCYIIYIINKINRIMKIRHLFLCLIICISCNKNKQLTPINMSYKILNDSIMISSPGFFKISGDYLYLSDLRATDSIINIYDKNTGKQLTSFGSLGNGPNEFTTPIINSGINGSITILNVGSSKLYLLNAQNLLNNKNGYIDLTPPQTIDSQSMQLIDENTYLYLSPDENNTLFKILNNTNNTITNFGEFPVTNEKKYINYKDIYQGEINYDYYNDYLLLKFIQVPEIILFKKNKIQFDKILSKKLSNYDYEIKNNNLQINYLEPCRTKMVSMTKNYIVLLDDSNINIEKRKTMKRPVLSRRQLILLDYKLESQKVIDLDMDIYLITSDSRSDDLYLIVANPEYSIIKIAL